MNISSPKRLGSRTDPLRPGQIHVSVPIFLSQISYYPAKSPLTQSRLLYLLSHVFLGTKCRLSRRKSLISHFPPQISRSAVPLMSHFRSSVPRASLVWSLGFPWYLAFGF